MISLNTNTTSLMVQRNLTKATEGINKAIMQLTTGYKLNSAKDNPADYAVLKNMESKLRGWETAADNISIGHSMLETAESYANLIEENIIRIRNLCEQSANGTYGEASIKAIRLEIEARVDEINRIKESAEFNDIKLFNKPGGINIQVGIDGSESSRINVNTDLNLDKISDIKNWDITNPECLDNLDSIIDDISLYQIRLGASQNRLECALELADINMTNLTSSISTIRDADIAKASSDLIRYQILQQACITLLSTANQMPAMALQLL